MLSGYVPVMRRRRGLASKDQYGNPVPGQWEDVALPPAVFAPATSTEPIRAGAMPVTVPAALYWRNTTIDVTAEDHLIVDGIEYRVEGRPSPYPKGMVVQIRANEDKVSE